MNDIEIIKNILNTTDETQSSLARKLNVTRQFIGQVLKEGRKLSSVLRFKLQELYPTYFETIPIPDKLTKDTIVAYRKARGFSPAVFANLIGVSPTLQYGIEKGSKNITKFYLSQFKEVLCENDNPLLTIACDNNSLDDNYRLEPHNLLTKYVKVDKSLIPNTNSLNLRLIPIQTDVLSPVYEVGDKIILDESYTSIDKNGIYVFIIDDKTYIRQIIVTPNEKKCVAFNKKYDTFILTKTVNKVLGRILKTRF